MFGGVDLHRFCGLQLLSNTIITKFRCVPPLKCKKKQNNWLTLWMQNQVLWEGLKIWGELGPGGKPQRRTEKKTLPFEMVAGHRVTDVFSFRTRGDSTPTHTSPPPALPWRGSGEGHCWGVNFGVKKLRCFVITKHL